MRIENVAKYVEPHFKLEPKLETVSFTFKRKTVSSKYKLSRWPNCKSHNHQRSYIDDKLSELDSRHSRIQL